MGVNTNLETMITHQLTIIARLDSILSALGTLPETPIHTFDELFDLITDIHTDTMSMDSKLLTIRNYMFNPADDPITEDNSSLLWNLYRLRKAIALDTFPAPAGVDPMQYTLREFWDYFYSQWALLLAGTGDIRNYIYYGLLNLGLELTEPSTDYSTGSYLRGSLNAINGLWGASGTPIQANNQTIIQLLYRLVNSPPVAGETGLYPIDLCGDAYISSTMALIPGVFDLYPTTLWAVFPSPPPPGITFGTVFGLGVDNSELIPDAGDWDGWRIYVASNTGNFGLYMGADITASAVRYPTNTWVDLAGYNEHLSVYVPGDASLRVFLCGGGWTPAIDSGGPWGGGPGGTVFEECAEAEPILATVTYPPGTTPAGHTRYVVPLSIFGLPGVGSMIISGDAYSYSIGDGVTNVNMRNSRVKLVSGPRVRAVWVTADGNAHAHTITTIGDSYIIPDDTDYFSIDNWHSNDVSPGDIFIAELCPPET